MAAPPDPAEENRDAPHGRPFLAESLAPIRFSCAGPALCEKTFSSLRKLDRLSRQGLLEKLVGKFLEDGRTALRALAAHMAAGREEAFREAVHHLKGSCQVLGALRMDRLCQRLLELGPGAAATRSALVAELALAFEEIQRSLWSLREEPPESG